MARERLLLATLLGAGALLAVSACSRSSDGGSSAKSGANAEAQAKGDVAAAPVPSGPPLAGEDFYRVDAAPLPECAVGKACEVTFVLTALGEYKVNKEYPFKFVADEKALRGGAIDGSG